MEFKHVMQKETFNETLKLLTNNMINRTLPLTDQTLHLLLTKYPGNIRKKKRRPDVDSVFNHIAKSSATNIDRGIVESTLTELINQKIISNKKTSSGCDSLHRSQKSANNWNIPENSSKNQANLDASQISLKDRVPPVNVAIQDEKKREVEINALRFEAQLWVLESYINCDLSAMNNKLDFFSQCLLKNASCQSNNENKDFETLQDFCSSNLLQNTT